MGENINLLCLTTKSSVFWISSLHILIISENIKKALIDIFSSSIGVYNANHIVHFLCHITTGLICCQQCGATNFRICTKCLRGTALENQHAVGIQIAPIDPRLLLLHSLMPVLNGMIKRKAQKNNTALQPPSL